MTGLRINEPIYRCHACNGSHVLGWAGCVMAGKPETPTTDAQRPADALAPATGHTETPGTREGLTLAQTTELLDQANAVMRRIVEVLASTDPADDALKADILRALHEGMER